VNGVPLNLIDTAGRRESADTLERESVLRAEQQIALADLVLVVVEAGEGETRQANEQIASLPAGKPYILVANKVDRLTNYQTPEGWLSVSAVRELGLEELREAIAEKLGFGEFEPEQPMVFTRRQHELLQSGLACTSGEELLETLHNVLQQGV
jgi:tRNA modification GTPase